MPNKYKPEYKIETDFAMHLIPTYDDAVKMGKKASLIAGCDVEIFIKSPWWAMGDPLKLGEWLKLGNFCEGIYYPT